MKEELQQLIEKFKDSLATCKRHSSAYAEYDQGYETAMSGVIEDLEAIINPEEDLTGSFD